MSADKYQIRLLTIAEEDFTEIFVKRLVADGGGAAIATQVPSFL